MAKYLALAIVLCVALSLAAVADQKKTDVKPEPGRKVAEKWEYAELYYKSTITRGGRGGFGGFGGGAVQPGAPGAPGAPNAPAPAPAKAKVTVRWVTGDSETEATSWEDLATKLKAPAGAKGAKATVQKLKILNYLGRQGWEMVSHDSYTWTFKRKITK